MLIKITSLSFLFRFTTCNWLGLGCSNNLIHVMGWIQLWVLGDLLLLSWSQCSNIKSIFPLDRKWLLMLVVLCWEVVLRLMIWLHHKNTTLRPMNFFLKTIRIPWVSRLYFSCNYNYSYPMWCVYQQGQVRKASGGGANQSII